MSDDRFDEWVREAAQGYNHPGPAPREEMWQAIQAARQSASASKPEVRAWGRRISGAPTWRLAAAAVVLVAVGVGIGYGIRDGASNARSVVVDSATVTAPDGGLTAYDVKTAEHLTSAAMLLTSFQAPSDAETAESVHRWARNLLSSTRLLLDSPAGDDAQRRELLEDLELILVQIMALAPDAPPSERAYLERTIAREEVLTRIRTSIPAGLPSGT